MRSMLVALFSMVAFATTAQANLLDDGSFDASTSNTRTSGSAWTLTSNIAEPDGAIFSESNWASRDTGGSGVWFKSFSGDNGTNPPADSLLTQSVVAAASGDYTLTFWSARETNHSATSDIASLISSGTGGSSTVDLATAAFNDDQNMGSNPTLFTLSLSGVTAGDTLTISVEELGGIANPGASESLMVDQFDLNFIPEPTSVALAGLGLLGLLGIRRRR